MKEKNKRTPKKELLQLLEVHAVFFNSGGRIVGLFNIKCGDVNFPNQAFKVTIKKGRESKEVKKVIKDIALPFWKELLNDSQLGFFVFSKGLISGLENIRREQLTRRWNVHVGVTPFEWTNM